MPPRRKTKTGELFFGIDARHIRQLGQELVGDRTTALTELVKNAYDADATLVSLRFQRAGRKGGALEVADDGNGMNLADIERGWMRISTNAKNVADRSPRYGRVRAGRKGIGRFATETLGRKLILRTTVEGESTSLNIEFDWEDDYPSGIDLVDVPNVFWEEEATKEEHGTTLRIEGLYDAWDEPPRRRVRKAIRLLQPPFPSVPVAASKGGRKRRLVDPGFRVAVEVNGRPDPMVLLGYDDFLQAGTARVSANINRRGLLAAQVNSPHFNLDEELTFKDRFPKAAGLSLEAAYFVFRSDALGGVGVRVAQKMANEFAGIRLYRDDLRVMPYGERENDWLGLDQAQGKRSTLVPIANLNWFGQISISRHTNQQLLDTASREGLVENEAFAQLVEAARQTLIWAASEVGRARNKKVTTSKGSGTQTRRSLVNSAQKTLVRSVKEDLPKNVSAQVLPLIEVAFEDSSDRARESDAAERSELEAMVDEVELLRVLASLGTSMAVFSHEVRSALTRSSAALGALATGKGAKGSAEKLELANDAVEELQDLAGYIDAYVSSTQRRERKPQAMESVIDEFTERISKNLARHVKFKTSVKPLSLRTVPMARSELQAMLFNLLTNSIKAMDGDGQEGKEISISAQAHNGEVRLRFQDTGAGIDPKISDRIFEPFVTDTRRSLSELGTGTGLGLKIVKDIVEDHGGKIAVADPDTPFRTCIEITLPRWKKQKGKS
jgi:signal transduction histidine kinase